MVGEMNSAVSPVDFDRMLNGLDRIYSEFARACGLSDCAYWMLVDTSAAGGSVAVSRLTSEWFYSKQTINSAIKTLRARGLATLEFAEGSRKNKVVRLTEEGVRFAKRYALPAQKPSNRHSRRSSRGNSARSCAWSVSSPMFLTKSARHLNGKWPLRTRLTIRAKGRHATLNEVYEAVSRADCGDAVCGADR